MSYIRLENLAKYYGNGEAAVHAVRDANFNIETGEFVAIMGESGSGKSTLLSIMGALNSPTRGRYIVDEIDVYTLSQDQRAEFRKEFIGFVFQSFNLIPYLTVEENVMLPLTTSKIKESQKRTLAERALERVGLSAKRRRLPSEISGGEQERVAVARAIVNEPPLLLADEPTGNLDSKTSQSIMGLFRNLNADGMTIAMVTHSADCARHAESILRVADGLVLAKEALAPAAANRC